MIDTIACELCATKVPMDEGLHYMENVEDADMDIRVCQSCLEDEFALMEPGEDSHTVDIYVDPIGGGRMRRLWND